MTTELYDRGLEEADLKTSYPESSDPSIGGRKSPKEEV